MFDFELCLNIVDLSAIVTIQ